MAIANYTISNETGLHIRPITNLIMASKKFPSCRVEIRHNDETAVFDSPMNIIMLCLVNGSNFTLETFGDDHENCLTALDEVLKAEKLI